MPLLILQMEISDRQRNGDVAQLHRLEPKCCVRGEPQREGVAQAEAAGSVAQAEAAASVASCPRKATPGEAWLSLQISFFSSSHLLCHTFSVVPRVRSGPISAPGWRQVIFKLPRRS